MDEEFQFVDVDNKEKDEEEIDDFDEVENPLNMVETEDNNKIENVVLQQDYVDTNKKKPKPTSDSSKEDKKKPVKDKDEKDLVSLKVKFNDLIKKQEKEYNEIVSLKKSLKKELTNVKKIKSNYETDYKSYNELTSALKKAKLEFEQDKALFLNEKQSLSTSMKSLNDKNEQLTQLMKNYDAEYQKLKKLNDENNLSKKQLEKFLKQGKEFSQKLQQQVLKNSQLMSNSSSTKEKSISYISLDKGSAYCCAGCGTDIALHADIESQCYQVGQGAFTEKKRGFLFKNAVNLKQGVTKTENFTTGSYEISWVSCQKCDQELGWKYINADKSNNMGKVGKYCLSRYKLTSFDDRQSKLNN